MPQGPARGPGRGRALPGLGSAADHIRLRAEGQLGHLLGGAGAVEAIIALQSLNAGLIPRSVMQVLALVDLAITIDGSQAVSKRDGDPLLLKNAFGFAATTSASCCQLCR